jgi:Flp pilus assembly protein TadD
LEETPGDAYFWILLSYAYLQEGKDTEGAERTLRKILELEPDNVEAKNNLELLLRRRGTVGVM